VEKRWFPQEKGSRKIMRGGGLENKERGFSEDQTMVASIFTKPCRLKTAYTATYIDMLIYRINVYIYIYIYRFFIVLLLHYAHNNSWWKRYPWVFAGNTSIREIGQSGKPRLKIF